ncbi:MAG: right-handed parallel beta-helix repeat-containing protein [Paenibacillus sp.]|nr:right-handed parallel beta-helix repeat-containing protein [Paenibacillus sp.]
MSNEMKENAQELSKPTSISRRKLLASLGMVGVAMAAGSLGTVALPKTAEASALTGFVNVKTHSPSAAGDNATNDAGAIQSAINSLNTTGGVVYFPRGTYLVGTSLTIPSNVTLEGESMELSIIRDHSSLGSNRILTIIGASGSTIKNIKLRDLTIRNGTAPPSGTSPTLGKDGIRADYVDGLQLERCMITEIQGNFSFWIRWSKNIYVNNCVFYRHSFSGMSVGADCENIKVLNTVFDTVTTLSAGNAYHFSTGGETVGEGTYWPKNVWVENCKFLNNPKWEGLELHGGENVWFLNNYIENCRFGIAVQNDSPKVSKPYLNNITIENNTVVKTDEGVEDGYGILAQGVTGILAEGVVIRGNKVIGYGPTVINTTGAINLTCLKNFVVENNIIDNFYQNAICLSAVLIEGVIKENFIGTCAGYNTLTETAAILIRGDNGGGIFGVVIEENTVSPKLLSTDTNLNKIPRYFINNNHQRISVQIRNNAINHIYTALYKFPNHMNVGWGPSTPPTGGASTGIIQRAGDVIYDTDFRPAWYVNRPSIGYGSLYTGSVATGSIAASSPILTLTSGATYHFPPGMNIKVAGAGAGSGDLIARVVNNESATQLQLDKLAIMPATGANIYYDTLTFVIA